MESRFMKNAILLAKKAAEYGEVPVGAVIVRNGEIIAEGHNMRETKQSALSHAEIEAIRIANKKLDSWRLDDCEMYVTLEPCPMCTGAIINARLKTLVFGAYDTKQGCADSLINMFDLPFDNKTEVYGGILEDECKEVLKTFFKCLRNEE